MLEKIHRLLQIFYFLGPGWLIRRVIYELQLRTGYFRKILPIFNWEDQPLTHFCTNNVLVNPKDYLTYRRREAPVFFFNPEAISSYSEMLRSWDRDESDPISLSDELALGKFQYFGHNKVQAGYPPDWHSNPFSGLQASVKRHWSQIPDFGLNDIKVIWEPNRFSFTYLLVRAYARTGDEKYARFFWQLVENWKKCNLPQTGPNWKCGQEVSFRIMALCFGLYGFLFSKETTALRVAALAQIIAVSGQRIEANVGYALNQRNNHGISEALGLWTIGILFPEFKAAKEWVDLGQSFLERQALELIYDDGSFVQHSMNYQRLMLHDYLWCIRLGELNGQPFSTTLKNRVIKAGDFLYQVQDKETGRIPRYGQNDGALILPLNNCNFQDYRPVVQAVYYLGTRKRIFKKGPWDEDLFWLFGPETTKTEVQTKIQTNLNATLGGYYTLRSSRGFCFIRCATFNDRPGQADMLHVDLWWRGHNVVIDPGTFSYNSSDPWNNPLAHSAYHNTVTVNGQDQMDRVSKFIWLPWLKSRLIINRKSSAGHLTYLEGEHNGYQRFKFPVRHRRGVLQLADEHWLVIDRLSGLKENKYRLHWLFPGLPFSWEKEIGQLKIKTSTGVYQIQIHGLCGEGFSSLVSAAKGSPRGWYAPYYYCKEPAISLELTVKSTLATFFSFFGPMPANMLVSESTIEFVSEKIKATVDICSDPDNEPVLLKSTLLEGAFEDRIDIL